jgi:hypothetical protein
LLLCLVASTLPVIVPRSSWHASAATLHDGATNTPLTVPTVSIVQTTPQVVPTVNIPRPTAVPTPTPRPVKHRVVRHHSRAKAKKTPTPRAAAPRVPQRTWITAYLTSYCPGSAGWIASSGMQVFYGMLANNYYAFGTRVYLPVLGITGVVEDRLSAFPSWNHFDVWSAVCYGTPTGYYRVAVETG